MASNSSEALHMQTLKLIEKAEAKRDRLKASLAVLEQVLEDATFAQYESRYDDVRAILKRGNMK